MSHEAFDLIVIGGGSGGLASAIRAAKHGAKVVLVEPRELGGLCVNHGCVPKKAMWYAAQMAEAQYIAHDYGFTDKPGTLDWPGFIARRQAYIERIHGSYRQQLDKWGVTLVHATARFIDSRRIAVGDRVLTAPHIIIATGSSSNRLDKPGFDLGVSSDGFFDLRACPKRTAIVGGGYVAVELAGVLRALGSEVDLYVRNRLMGGFDEEMAYQLGEEMTKHGIAINYECQIEAVHGTPGALMLDCDRGTNPGPYDLLIWAVGRHGNTASLDLAAIGLGTNGDGQIDVDDFQETGVPGVYAVGDVTQRMALTPVAVNAGRKLADRLFGNLPKSKLDYQNIPSVVFSHPPLGTVGMSEQEAREAFGDDVHLYKQTFVPMQLALAHRPMYVRFKLICVGEDSRIVGMQMLGPGVDEILQGFAVAVKMGATKADLDATMAIHPTSAEEMVTMGDRVPG
ncbi:glutathione-disulfide reductase [Luteibacter aegosomatissinici]|uniref:glutathione-disulfide reductase n=1 Tax=Luteibacter aegosomatissinici TaxID=2911539 RepID=UPI001FFB6E86|nr:glutathione-disulfide reductase [Luteibacter aegosomatissinici]UPG93288.1 glutathione-disulfide reductase [Luteibacter aegosomatissinici]